MPAETMSRVRGRRRNELAPMTTFFATALVSKPPRTVRPGTFASALSGAALVPGSTARAPNGVRASATEKVSAMATRKRFILRL